MSGSVDERLVADAARGLRGDAGLPFTERQLWYAVCARMERPEVTQGVAQIVAGVLLVTIGVVAGILATIYVASLVPVGMVVIGIGVENRRAERNRPQSRALAVSFDAFVRATLTPMRAGAGAALDGLLPAAADTVERPAPAAPAATDGAAAVAGEEPLLLVCDRGETAALVAALAAHAGTHWRPAVEDDAMTLVRGRRVVSLHDADPRGCALPLRLAAAGAAEVVDVGLRPAQLQTRRVQVIEGAPYVVAAELARLLTPDEVVWLAEGRRVELATLDPAELIAGLRRAIDAPPRPAPGGGRITLAGDSPLPAALEVNEAVRDDA